MDSPSRDNVSYTLKFRGPVLQCSSTTKTHEKTLHLHTFTDLCYYPTMRCTRFQLDLSEFVMGLRDHVFSLNSTSRYGSLNYFPCLEVPEDTNQRLSSITNVTILQRVENLECLPGTGQYTINFNYINGQQIVDYSVIDKQLLPRSIIGPWDNPGPSWRYTVQDLGPLGSVEDHMNFLALIDASLRPLIYEEPLKPALKLYYSPELSRIPNGTSLEVCSAESYDSDVHSAFIMEDGTLNTHKPPNYLTTS
jgi:hypothetical protein